MKNVTLGSKFQHMGRRLLIALAIAGMASTTVLANSTVANAGGEIIQVTIEAPVAGDVKDDGYATLSKVGWGGCGACGK